MVVLWSRVLMRHRIDEGLCSYSSWVLVELDVDVLAVVPPWLFGLWSCSLLSWAAFVFGESVVSDLSLLVGSRREGAVVVLVVLPFLVLLLVDSVEASVLISGWGLCVVGRLRSRVLAGRDRFPHCFIIRAVSAAFASCGVSARWRDLRRVVLDICRQ